MCLLSVGLETLGLLLRIWLWISVPMAVLILMIATWMNYMRNARPKGELTLAVEGLGGEMVGGGDTFIGRDDVVGEGRGMPAEEEESPEPKRGSVDEEDELTATGKETIYRGILWMKEKYEQYREQADRRDTQMREELARSERRYQELMAVMEQRKNDVLGTVTEKRAAAGMTAGEGEIVAEGGAAEERGAGGAVGVAGAVDERAAGGMMEEGRAAGPELGVQLAEARGQLEVKQGMIDDLEGQLRLERTKVEELVVKLQANSQLLLTIYQELDKSFKKASSLRS